MARRTATPASQAGLLAAQAKFYPHLSTEERVSRLREADRLVAENPEAWAKRRVRQHAGLGGGVGFGLGSILASGLAAGASTRMGAFGRALMGYTAGSAAGAGVGALVGKQQALREIRQARKDVPDETRAALLSAQDQAALSAKERAELGAPYELVERAMREAVPLSLAAYGAGREPAKPIVRLRDDDEHYAAVVTQLKLKVERGGDPAELVRYNDVIQAAGSGKKNAARPLLEMAAEYGIS